jgi:capsular exopolysaccharide synthesis family protein
MLIDADLHRPRQHKMIGVDNKEGLANVLMGEISLESAIKETSLPNLHFIPSGRLNSSVHGLLNSTVLADIIASLREHYDWVFFDAPPIIGVSDASLIMRQVDGVCLVIQHRKYPRAISKRAKDAVDNLGANLLGVILNNINVSKDYSYYYYQQHYYYYPKKDGTMEKKRK